MKAVSLDFSKVFSAGLQMYVDGQTSRVWGKPKVPYSTIQSVIEDPNATKKETLVEKIKWGQVKGAISLGLSGLFYWFGNKLESGFWKGLLYFTSATSVVGGITSALVGSFCNNSVEKTMQEVLEKYIAKRSPTEGGLETVALSKTNRGKLNKAVEEAKNNGVVLNIYGPVGTGKTVTAERFAAELMEKGVCKKAVFWDAQREVLSYGLTDSMRRIFGSLIPGETVEQRLERAAANAYAHYKKTGEYVVLVLNEAELLLEGEDSKDKLFGTSRTRSKVDPKDRPELVQKFADLVDKVKRECKGVALVLTANTLEDSFAFLERRFTTGSSIIIERPDAETRKELIKITIDKKQKEDASLNLSLSARDFEELSRIGTVDILDKIKAGNSYSHFSGSSGSWKYGCEFLGAYEDMMKKFNVLNGQEVRDAVEDAILEKKNGSSKNLKDLLEYHLKQKTKGAEAKLKTWEDEFRQRAGKSSSSYYD